MPFDVNETIQVAIRGRLIDGNQCVEFNSALKQVFVSDNEVKQFTFNHVFDLDASQQTVFETLAKPVLGQFLNGYNACIMAYGQTGSGKTFTMGTEKRNEEDKGIIPRLMEDFFLAIENKGMNECEISVSFIEVYNNDVFDLLSSEQTKINVREDSSGIKLPDLTDKVVNNLNHALKYLEYGIDSRRTSSTIANSKSSRSHAIFTISMEQKQSVSFKNRLQLVDLAGSEGSETWNIPSIAREGISINKSLLALGNVIKALKEKQNHVPYRGSILTRLLQESLGGRSYTLMIGCVNPKANSTTETINTLRFASKACGIQKKPLTYSIPRSTLKRNPGNNLSISKPTPSKFSRPIFNLNTPDSATSKFTSPVCNILLSKLEKKLFSTPNIDKFASRILEKATQKQLMSTCCEETSISESTLLPEERILNNSILKSNKNSLPDSDFEPITGSLMLPLVEETPTKNDEISKKGKLSLKKSFIIEETPSLIKEPEFAVPHRYPLRKRRNLDSSTVETQNSFVLPQSVTTPKGKHRYRTLLVPESSFLCTGNSINSINLRRKGKGKENSDMSFDVFCTPNLISNQTVIRCQNPCEIMPSPRRGWKIQMNTDVQMKHNVDILKMLNGNSIDVLKSLPTIGPKTAWIIWNWRQKHGQFVNVSDLQRVDGLPKSFFKRFVRATLVNHIDL